MKWLQLYVGWAGQALLRRRQFKRRLEGLSGLTVNCSNLSKAHSSPERKLVYR